MAEVRRIADQLKRAFDGDPWYGSPLMKILNGVTAEQAAARPVAGAHSIWEIVLHIAVWAEIARARLKGQSTGDPPPDQDWPAVTGETLDDWRIAVERLGFSHRLLAADVRELDDPQLDALVPGQEYTVSVLLHGVVEHGTDHGGQIMILSRAGG